MIAVDPWTLLLVWLFWPKDKKQKGTRQFSSGMVFPVTVSAASFSNDYNPPKHMGIDVFAEEGTAVFAPEGGTVRFTTDPKGGLVFYLKGASGTSYYGAHLQGYVGSNRTVRAGEQIGFVGKTGNARDTAAHLHFQIDGGKTDPYPILHRLAPNAPEAPWARNVA